MDTVADPLAEVTHWDAAAGRAETPCGDGHMAWRSWGDGRPLVLLHGGSGSWRHWIRTLPVLAGRRVLAPDLPGLGDSDLPPMPWSAANVGAVVAAGVERLLGPDQDFDLMGFSFGALVSSGVVTQLADRIGTLVLAGASGLGTARNKVEMEKVRDKEGAARMDAHRTNLARLMFADPANIDAQALAIQEWNTRHARLKSMGQSPPTVLRDALDAARSRGPARLCAVWGAEDAVGRGSLPERATALRALHPQADIRVIPGAGHWVAYEAADRFNPIVLEMLGPEALGGA